MELDVYCDPTAETPLYEPIGEDVNQGLYVFHITSKWACKENTNAAASCSGATPGKQRGKGGSRWCPFWHLLRFCFRVLCRRLHYAWKPREGRERPYPAPLLLDFIARVGQGRLCFHQRQANRTACRRGRHLRRSLNGSKFFPQGKPRRTAS